MKKIIAVMLSLTLMLSIFAGGGITIYADGSRTDVIDLYDSADGATPNTSADAWGYFVVGGNVWGEDSCCNVDVEKLREYLRDGSYNLSFICTGTPSENDPVAVINGDFDNGVKMSVAMLDDGRYEVTIPLKDVLDGYGKTVDEVESLCVQTWINNFALYHISLFKLPEGASDTGAVYRSESGATPNTSKDAYGFFVVGGNVWGQDTCCGISAEKMRKYFRDGGYNLSFVFGGTPGDSAPVAVINGGFEGGVAMTVKELGDGRHEATIPLQAVLEGYGKTADEVDGLCVQTWVNGFALYEIRLYKSEAEPEPEPEVELNVYWYPAQHDNTSTWDNTYYEGFTGDEYYDVFGKETEIVKDVSSLWDIAIADWSYIWLGIEDKQHDPRHSFTVEVSNIVFRTADSEYTYSGADGEHTFGGSGIIPVKVSDVCGGQNTTDFLRGLETITVTLICTEHDGKTADVPDEPCSHPEENREWKSDAESHWQVCNKCGEEVPDTRAAHDALTYEDNGDNSTHTVNCTTCGYSGEEEHIKGEQSHDDSSHWTVCTKCDAHIDEAEHVYDYVSDGAEGHHQKCSVCDYETETAAHSAAPADGKYTDSGDGENHTYLCADCGDTVTEAHSPGEQSHDDSSHWTVCTKCGAHIDEAEHVYDYVSDGAQGHHQKCSVCDYETETAAHSAAPADGKYTDSGDGESHTYLCAECEETVTESHSWDKGVVHKATETEAGYTLYTCTLCKATKRVNSEHEHNGGEEWVTDETSHWHQCTLAGCPADGGIYDKAAHTDDEGTVTKAATEAEEGVMTYKCTVCGRVTRTEAIPKLKHTHVEGDEWKSDEKTHWHECVSETCDDKSVRLSEAEHVWDDGKVTVEPTYTEEGEKLFTCEVCKATKTETIPVNAHDHETVMKSDENGHWYECTLCGEVIGEVEAHTPGEWITDSEATSSEAGKRHKECTVCGYATETLTVPATGNIDVEVPTVGNVPKVEIPAEQQEVLKDAVIDEEDVAAIENGASIDIVLTVEDAEKTVAPEDKALIDAKTSEGEYRHVAYLDITLTKTVTDTLGTSTTEEISEISRPINIVIEVPYALSRTYRTFAVIRVHDGVAEVLSDLDSDPKTVTISTDLFSSYALVYTDGEHQQESVGGLIGHAHIITDIRHDSEYHWRGCFLCSIRVDYAPHTFVDGVCPICGYVDPDYVPSEEVEDAEVSIEAPAEGTDQTGDSEGTPEITDTPAYLPENEAEVVEVKEDEETSENPKTGVIFTGIGAVMAAIAALIAKRK